MWRFIVHFLNLACESLERLLKSKVFVDYELSVCDTCRPGKNFSADIGLVEIARMRMMVVGKIHHH